jgi:hypothetical protein
LLMLHLKFADATQVHDNENWNRYKFGEHENSNQITPTCLKFIYLETQVATCHITMDGNT